MQYLMTYRVWILLLALLLRTAYAIEEEDLLPPEQAFALTAMVQDADTLTAEWVITEGYYMYQQRFRFQSDTPGIVLGEPRFPPGKVKQDEFFGQVETYRHRVAVEIPILSRDETRQLVLKTVSQGCADLGICYPPQTQRVTVDLPPPPIQSTQTSLFSSKSGLLGSKLGIDLGTSDDDDLLAPDQAFVLSLHSPGPQILQASWNIAEGYYLYTNKLKLSLEDASNLRIIGMDIPAGEPIEDEFYGQQEVFYERATATARLQGEWPDSGEIQVKVAYQGCAEIGVCYPPISHIVPVTLNDSAVAAATLTAALPLLAEQDQIAQMLVEQRFWSLPAFFGFGLLLAFTPCVFPMIPILSSIIVGQGKSLTQRQAFSLSLVYVLAMAVTYTIAGVLAALLGQNIQALFQNPWILSGFSALFVLLALSMFGFYDLQLPASWQSRLTDMSNRQRGGRYAGVAAMGLLSALIVGPCVAAPLIGVLTVIGVTGDAVLGGTALFAMSLGMGAPLLAIGASAGKLLPKAGHWMDKVKILFGVLLLGVAIWMLERILPEVVTVLLWAMLMIGAAIYLLRSANTPVWHPLAKGLGSVLLVYGILVLVGVANGAKDVLQPLRGAGLLAASEPVEFHRIKTVTDLNQAIANAEGQPVLLDFYADWCVSCKEMERYTFSNPAVQAALGDTLLLQADVTANDAEDQALLQRFGIFGPPAILFFGTEGVERSAFRVVGFMPADRFQNHLNLVLSL